MSELKNTLLADIKEAMKSKEKEKLVTLRGLSAGIKQIEVDARKEIEDSDVIDVARKEIKKRRDAIDFAKKANRDDMVTKNEQEIAILENYLGEQLSEQELDAFIKDKVDSGASNIGAIMGALNKEHKGKFEGRVASSIAKKYLG